MKYPEYRFAHQPLHDHNIGNSTMALFRNMEVIFSFTPKYIPGKANSFFYFPPAAAVAATALMIFQLYVHPPVVMRFSGVWFILLGLG